MHQNTAFFRKSVESAFGSPSKPMKNIRFLLLLTSRSLPEPSGAVLELPGACWRPCRRFPKLPRADSSDLRQNTAFFRKSVDSAFQSFLERSWSFPELAGGLADASQSFPELIPRICVKTLHFSTNPWTLLIPRICIKPLQIRGIC